MFSLEMPQGGHSNKCSQYTFSQYEKKTKNNILNYSESAAIGFFPRDSKEEFETAVVNKPSVFEPLKFYCISL